MTRRVPFYARSRRAAIAVTVVAILIVAGIPFVCPADQIDWDGAAERAARKTDASFVDPIDLARPIAERFEGLRLDPYHGPDGYAHVGYGHRLSDERDARLDRWPSIDEATADRLLEADLRSAAATVHALVRVRLAPNEAAALIDFVFNEGSDAFARSTLLRRLNDGDRAAVPSELRRWRYGDGRVLDGLAERRAAEARLWERR